MSACSGVPAAAAAAAAARVAAAGSRSPDHSWVMPRAASSGGAGAGVPGGDPGVQRGGGRGEPGRGGGRGAGVPGPAGGRQGQRRGGQPGRRAGAVVRAVRAVQQGGRGVQRGGRGGGLAVGQRERGGDQRGRRPGRGRLGRHLPEPAGQRAAAVRVGQRRGREFLHRQPGGQRPVPGRGGLPHRVRQQPVALVPAGRPPVQAGHLGRALQPQLEPQHLGEQRMVTVPAAAGRLDEGVAPGQLGQRPGALVPAGQLRRDPGADPVHDAGLQQQVPDLGGLVIQRLLHQVPGDRAVLRGQLLDELPRITMITQRQRRQPQPRRPPLIDPGQQLQRGRRQRDPVLGHQLARLGHAERQLPGPDLGQLPGQPVPVQRQHRIRPRAHHQPQPRPRVPQQVRQPLHQPRPRQLMQVIQHQHHRRILHRQLRRQPQQEHMIRRRRPGRRRRDPPQRHPRRPQRLHHRRPEHPRPAIKLIQRHPRHQTPPRRRPRRHRHRLTRPRRPRHHRQRPRRTLIQPPVQPRPRHQPPRHPRHPHLSLQHTISTARQRPRPARHAHSGAIHRRYLPPSGPPVASRTSREPKPFRTRRPLLASSNISPGKG